MSLPLLHYQLLVLSKSHYWKFVYFLHFKLGRVKNNLQGLKGINKNMIGYLLRKKENTFTKHSVATTTAKKLPCQSGWFSSSYLFYDQLALDSVVSNHLYLTWSSWSIRKRLTDNIVITLLLELSLNCTSIQEANITRMPKKRKKKHLFSVSLKWSRYRNILSKRPRKLQSFSFHNTAPLPWCSMQKCAAPNGVTSFRKQAYSSDP